MSDKKDSLETKLADAKAVARSMLKKQDNPIQISEESVVEVAKTSSSKDILLWIIAIVAFIAATLTTQHLPKYWAAANNSFVQLGITVALVVFGLICLAFTHQGAAFKILLKDAGVELKRISWPSKEETIRYTWQVLVVCAIVGFMVWILDNIFGYLIRLILG